MKFMRPYKGKLVTEEEYWTLVKENEGLISKEQYNKIISQQREEEIQRRINNEDKKIKKTKIAEVKRDLKAYKIKVSGTFAECTERLEKELEKLYQIKENKK